MGSATTSDASGIPLAEILAHFGTKGMKWGVRKDEGHEGETAKTSKIAKLDSQFEKKANTASTWVDVNNHAADLYNSSDVDHINKKAKYKSMDFDKDTPLRQAYVDEHADAFLKRLNQSADEHGTNASGTKKYTIKVLPSGGWQVTTVDVKHNAFPDSFIVEPKKNAAGCIVGVHPVVAGMAHFGVKGMHWGVRKDETPSSSSPAAKPVRRAADSADVKAVKKSEEKIDTHGTRVLSNNELQSVITRMNLEQQYSRLANPEVKDGEDAIKRILNRANQAQALHKHLNSPLSKAIFKAAKKASKTKAAKIAVGALL